MTHPIAAHGRHYLAIPGPSVTPDEVLRAMHRAPPNIYDGALVEMTHSLVPDLKRVARTEGNVAMYIGNGHAAWEAALANTTLPGDKLLVPATGHFAHSWASMAQDIGAQTEILDFGKRAPMDMAAIETALQADTDHQIKAVLAVHVDTSTGIRNDIAAVRAVLDRIGHPALLMADCIASLACDRFEMDEWGVDVMVAGCQKGLMVPPGMSFVFFNEKAAKLQQSLPRVSRYWNWHPRANPGEYYEHWCGTAPTQHVFGLRAALDILLGEGMDNVWARHATLARTIWAACDVWAAGGPLEINAPDPACRSHAVTALRLPPSGGTALRNWVEHNVGLTLGIGLGMADADDPARDGFFRIGHMGHLSGQMVMGMLGGIEAGLTALEIPRGAGALEAAAQALVSAA